MPGLRTPGGVPSLLSQAPGLSGPVVLKVPFLNFSVTRYVLSPPTLLTTLNREESKDVVLCPVGPARARVGRIALERAEFGHSGVRRKDGRILGGEEVVDLG